MSIVSNRHLFVPFVSGSSKAFQDQRLAKVSYKKKSGVQSQCVSVPMLTDSEVAQITAAYPVDARKRVEGMQDDLLKALFESKKSEVASEEIGKDQILAFLAVTEARFSSELVVKWWEGFQDTALPVLSEKYKTTDTEELNKKSNAWRDAFVSLCGKSVITKERIVQLASMLECSGLQIARED
jgi:hypothetical protein